MKSPRTVIVAIAITAILVGSALYLVAFTRTSDDENLSLARRASNASQWVEAERLAQQVLSRSEHSPEALQIAALAAARDGRQDDALNYFARLQNDGSENYVEAAFRAGEMHVDVGHAAMAERFYREALTVNRDSTRVHRSLGLLLAIQGRRWESEEHLFHLLRQQDITLDELILLGDVENDFIDETLTSRFLEVVPDDPTPLIGLARQAFRLRDYDTAEKQLSQVVAAHPNLIEAQAWLGRLRLEFPDQRGVAAWNAQLPPAADKHPMIWFVRGLWAKEQQQTRAAVRCFWESVKRDPNFKPPNLQLGMLLLALDEDALARPFNLRAERLNVLSAELTGLSQIGARHDAVVTMRDIAKLTESLGRLWEAIAWYQVISQADPNALWVRQEVGQIQQKLNIDTPRTRFSDNPARNVDLSSYPLPTWNDLKQQPQVVSPENSKPGRVHFVDMAEETGLRFTQYSGSDETTAGLRLLETTGGGVGILDFDGDFWPDVYLTQGSHWPPNTIQPALLDRLFRNHGDGNFHDVTEASGLGDTGFSQGVAVGDYNNDGFPDLYVANIGPNRLYQNNGDGTFTDASEAAGLQDARWTTSCLMADLNGDTWPDLYDVNYLGGSDVFDRTCEVDGRPRICQPTEFPAENDQLHLSLGNGQFPDQTSAAGIVGKNGKGLGILAADFDGSGKLSLFVANDTTANFFYRNQTMSRGELPAFTELGLQSGLGTDRRGRMQGCMGVAAGDADGDGLLDLFVTNFGDEPNALYLNRSRGELFIDETASRGLHDASVPLLGFGTQFVDGELDGWPDLIVTNGHVDDFRYRGKEFKMRPQYFQNHNGRFTELPAESCGHFFEQRFLGRALARLDWNRDGREDVVISHIGDATALLTNQTEEVGHFLAVRVRGVASDRDAIGTTIRVTVGDRTLARQLTGGDGYQASNQRQLIFGLANADRIDQLTVRWPAGTEQTFRDVPADREILIVEDSERFVELGSAIGPGVLHDHRANTHIKSAGTR